MMRKTAAAMAVIAMLALSGCARFEGQISEKVKTFEDSHGRVCTVVKYADSASIDCDFRP